ncbi:MAG: proline dehydrogenase family protein [Granulicella sp.]
MLRAMFQALSHNKSLRSFAEHSSLGRRLSSRFVAGMTVEDALQAAQRVNRRGIAVSLDSLGESATTEAQARAAADVYHRLLNALNDRRYNANVSVKLTHMGMNFSAALAEHLVAEIVAHAARLNSFVRIDMEGSDLTTATLDLVERLHSQPANRGHVGTVLQSSLYRTEADTERLLAQGIRIRLCKGAYQEGPAVAFARKADVDANYLKLAKRMIASPVFCGIATHDEAILCELSKFVTEQGIATSAFEFQMLYGIRRDLQRKLAAHGFGMRVYIPFGPEWFPYFMRRLAERPANVLFLAKNVFKN